MSIGDYGEVDELMNLARPGPFSPDRFLLGRHYGARVEGRLAAFAGVRLKIDGYAEVSSVCVHPDKRRLGLGRYLSTVVALSIAEEGLTPFLHVSSDNDAAIKLYEDMGFRRRRDMWIIWLDAE